jgi:hypothetical protein
MRVILTARADDYHACLEGWPDFWECADTPSRAARKLISRAVAEHAINEPVEVVLNPPLAATGEARKWNWLVPAEEGAPF